MGFNEQNSHSAAALLSFGTAWLAGGMRRDSRRFLQAYRRIGSARTDQLNPRAPIPGKSNPLHVDVVSPDWKWLFMYPDQGVAAVNQLVVPAGTPLNFASLRQPG